MSFDKRLAGALPERYTKDGVTVVKDADLRKALEALSRADKPTTRW